MSNRERQLRHLAQSKPKFREDIPDNDSGRDGDIVYVKQNNITESYIKEDGEWINLFTGTDVQRSAQQGSSRTRIIGGGISAVVPSGESGNHNLLLNLDDDDHPHYVHNIAPRTITANHTFSGNPTFSSNPIFSGNASFTGQPAFSNIDINGGDIASGVVINKSPIVNFNSGDVQGSITLTNLASGTGSLTIQADAVEGSMIADNAVTLTTHTTGNYMVNVTGNSQISVSHSQGEGSTASLSIAPNSIGNAQLEYDTGQHLTTSSNVQFGNITGSAIVGTTLNTGHGANELYPMNQGVRTTDNVQFGDVVVGGDDISSNSFSSGFTGSGWKIDNTSTAEFQNLNVRGTMSVYELLIQQIRATNGGVFITSSAKVDSWNSGTNQITWEDPSGHNLSPFQNNDLIMMQRVKIGKNTGTVSNIIKKLVYRVTATSGKTNTVVQTSQYTNSGSPEAGDEFVRIGNTSVSSRQGIIYLTSDDTNAPYMEIKDNIDSYNDFNDAGTTKVRLGKLDGITYDSANLSGYGLYSDNVYLTGKIIATSGSIGGININGGTLSISSSNISDVNAYTTNQDKQKLSTLNVDSPGSSGFYLTGTYLGYYDGSNFKTMMKNNGDFFLGGTSGSLTWTSNALTISGTVNATAGNFQNTITVGTHGSNKINISGTSSATTTMIESSNSKFQLLADGTAKFANGNIIFKEDGDIESQNFLIERTRLFGGGEDGSKTLTANGSNITSTDDGAAMFNRSGSVWTQQRDVYCNDLTLDNANGNITLKTNGFRIFVKGTLTIDANCVIQNDGSAPTSAGSHGQGSVATTSALSGGAGGPGGAGAPSGTLKGGVTGASGGTGGSVDSTSVNRPKATGGGGGGAGGSGGIVLIVARNIANSGTIRANGGAGGNGGNGAAVGI